MFEGRAFRGGGRLVAGGGECPLVGLGCLVCGDGEACADAAKDGEFLDKAWNERLGLTAMSPPTGRRGEACWSSAPAECRVYSIVKDLGARLTAGAEKCPFSGLGSFGYGAV